MSILVAIARDDPVSYDDAVAAGRVAAESFREGGTDVLVYLEKPGLGAWHLDQLTDEEAAAFAVRLAMQLRVLMKTSDLE